LPAKAAGVKASATQNCSSLVPPVLAWDAIALTATGRGRVVLSETGVVK
jgi:hypothetical protein